MASLFANDPAPVTPLYPWIMNAIFEMCNIAYGLSLLDTFQKSNTIIATSQELCFDHLVSESNRYKKEVMMCLLSNTVPNSIDILSIVLTDYSTQRTFAL